MSQGLGTFLRHRVGGRGLAGRFAPCPPAFGLLLDLRKTPSQPAPQAVSLHALTGHPFAAWERCIRRSEIKGEPAQRAEDIRGDGYAVAQAGSDKPQGSDKL